MSTDRERQPDGGWMCVVCREPLVLGSPVLLNCTKDAMHASNVLKSCVEVRKETTIDCPNQMCV